MAEYLFFYYTLESDDAQYAYLFGVIRPKAVKRCHGAAHVCKTTYMSIHGIRRGKLEYLQEQMKAGGL